MQMHFSNPNPLQSTLNTTIEKPELSEQSTAPELSHAEQAHNAEMRQMLLTDYEKRTESLASLDELEAIKSQHDLNIAEREEAALAASLVVSNDAKNQAAQSTTERKSDPAAEVLADNETVTAAPYKQAKPADFMPPPQPQDFNKKAETSEEEKIKALDARRTSPQQLGKTNLFSGLMSSVLGGLGALGTGSQALSTAAQKPAKTAGAHRENQHEMLVKSMTHSANKVAAMSAALVAGDLAPVLNKMKESGISFDELSKNKDYKELHTEYTNAMSPHAEKMRQELDNLAFYSEAATKSAFNQGVNIGPEVSKMMENVEHAAKDISLPDKEGNLKKVTDELALMMEKIQEVVRGFFSRFSPK